jgi:AcrR family transcriptional regulator
MDDKTKNIFLESARLFIKYGLRNLSMDDISRELGISKKTLYQICENKADLIDKILQYHLDASHQFANADNNTEKNAIAITLDLSHWACDHMKEFTPQHTFELQKYYPEVYKRFMERKRKDTYTWIRTILEKGIHEGLYRENIDIDLAAAIHIKNLEDLFDHEFLATVDVPFGKLFEATFENHIRSIATPKGLEYFEKRIAEMHDCEPDKSTIL